MKEAQARPRRWFRYAASARRGAPTEADAERWARGLEAA